MQNNRWAGTSVLPYGSGWGTSTPGGVASCMTWEPTNSSTMRDSRLPYRPASASISSGETQYFLKPNLNYERRIRGLITDATPVYPVTPHPHSKTHSTQTTPHSFNIEDSKWYGHRGPSRCDEFQTHRSNEPMVDWTCNCCPELHTTNATRRMQHDCQRCRHHHCCQQHQTDRTVTPRPPRIRKQVQFSQENNKGRVIEIVEDTHGNPVKMTVTRPSTAINRVYSSGPREINDGYYGPNEPRGERMWARRRYVQTEPETMQTTGCDAGDLRQIVADDVKRLMDVYQAGKADGNFHKGISQKWRSTVVNGRPEELEEVFVEEQRQRWNEDGCLMERPVRPGYSEHRDCHRNGVESRTAVSRFHGRSMTTCQAHGFHDVRRKFTNVKAEDESSQNERVKVQVECPANVDTVVNLRVRASDIDYQFR